MRKHGLTYILFLLFCAFSSSASSQEDENAWNFLVDSITVTGFRNRLPVKSDVQGVTTWEMSDMNLLPQLLGHADPMHYAQMLPGIQTNNEYRGGINIEGCDNQHNMITIEGVPIYNVNHLLGFFSTFNSSHFRSISIAKGLVNAGSPNRIGGQMDMQHPTDIPDSINGNLSVGLISSQGTLHIPVGQKTSVSLSFRGSYINLLYSRWLKADEQQIKYSFYDANLTLSHQVDKHNLLLFDFYSGRDAGVFSENDYLVDMQARWGNNMGAIHWFYKNGEGMTAKTTAFLTSYRNRFLLDMQDLSFRLPSGITDIGLKSDFAWKGWNVGAELSLHHISPQSLEHDGGFNMSDVDANHTHSLESSLYVNYECRLTENIKVLGGIRGSCLAEGNHAYTAVDPSLRFLYDKPDWNFSVTYAVRHQYLFQTGFSDLGLPTEFWMSSSKQIKPQYAHEYSANYSTYLFGRKYKIGLDLFYRRLYNQTAYKGSVLDYVNSVYDINNSLLHGNGENYGFSLILNKCTGALTGWMGYTYTHARRSFDEERRKESYPASHERPHELNAVATYSVGKHWNFGGTIVYASGTPFTPTKSIYLLNNNIITKYGKYNSARLEPYVRLDLSANYKWLGKRMSEHGINFSLYNVTSRKNELFYYVRTRKDGSFAYRPVTFILFALPSVSYYYKF